MAANPQNVYPPCASAAGKACALQVAKTNIRKKKLHFGTAAAAPAAATGLPYSMSARIALRHAPRSRLQTIDTIE